MRRLIAIAVALGLVVALAVPTAAATPASKVKGSSFNGNFNIYDASGNLVDHITATLSPTSPSQPLGGSYTETWSGGVGYALPTDVVFYHYAPDNEVWFNCLEIMSGGRFSAFTARFVQPLNSTSLPYVEAWVRQISSPMSPGAFDWTDPSPNHYGPWTVQGTFQLTVAQ